LGVFEALPLECAAIATLPKNEIAKTHFCTGK
jgi:hypothetical protein